MSWLLIDNSNTRTKFSLGDADRLFDWRAVLATAEITTASLAAVLEGISFDAVLICSVVPAKAAVLRGFFEGRWPLHFLDDKSPLGMGIDYPQPSQIGADRL
ncbi:type III pantothenate kinase, partial [bacterium]|nr:type III pantothenate kinase [bacterium]